MDQLRHTSSHSDARIGHRIAPVDAVFPRKEDRTDETNIGFASAQPSNCGRACATGTILACARRGAEDITQSPRSRIRYSRYYDPAGVYFIEYIRTVFNHVKGDGITKRCRARSTAHRIDLLLDHITVQPSRPLEFTV